jgi:hypothetical protein
MAGHFGNGVTLKVNSLVVGAIKSITAPATEHARVDFTVLGDTYQQMQTSPVAEAQELEFTCLMDLENIANQKAIRSYVGTNTAYACEIDFPWGATDDVYSFSAKLYGVESSEITSGDAIEITFKAVLTTTITIG